MYSTFFFYVFDFIANLLFPFVFEFLFSTQIRHYSLSKFEFEIQMKQLAAVLEEGEVTDQLFGKLPLTLMRGNT